jgi:plastocyanin
MKKSRVSNLLVTACVLAMVPLAGAQPRRKARAATQEDIARLEKKIEDQQKVIDRLVRLQQQIMQVTAQALDAAQPQAAAPVDPPEPAKVAEPVAPSKAKPIAKEAKSAFGTVVGKIANGADAIVYVETVSAPVHGVTATMKQQGKAFIPSTLVVTAGTKVEFPNLDAIFHNVFSVTPDYSFDLGSYRQGESKSVTMTKTGVVTVYCNMHPQMVGHILVVPNANYVRAGKDGFFRLTNVPAGEHRIVAWVPNAKAVSVETNVVENEVATVEMQLKRGAEAPHLKKDGLPYGSYDK